MESSPRGCGFSFGVYGLRASGYDEKKCCGEKYKRDEMIRNPSQ